MSDLAIWLRAATTEIETLSAGDAEIAHSRADSLLVEALEKIGGEAADLAEAWKRRSQEWWWA